MALKKGDTKNFQTLLKAAQNNHLCLIESKDKATGEYRALICAISGKTDGAQIIVPLAQMVTGNPYDIYEDPTKIS